MTEHHGMPWILVAVVLVIVSLFFDFFNNGIGTSGLDQLIYLFTQFPVYLNYWQIFFSDPLSFFLTIENFVAFVSLLIAPLFLIIGILFLLIGIKSRIIPGVGIFMVLFSPMVFLITLVIIPIAEGFDLITAILYLQPGFYLMIIAGILALLGIVKNKK